MAVAFIVPVYRLESLAIVGSMTEHSDRRAAKPLRREGALNGDVAEDAAAARILLAMAARVEGPCADAEAILGAPSLDWGHWA
jgi:hypothetical protein